MPRIKSALLLFLLILVLTLSKAKLSIEFNKLTIQQFPLIKATSCDLVTYTSEETRRNVNLRAVPELAAFVCSSQECISALSGPVSTNQYQASSV